MSLIACNVAAARSRVHGGIARHTQALSAIRPDDYQNADLGPFFGSLPGNIVAASGDLGGRNDSSTDMSNRLAVGMTA